MTTAIVVAAGKGSRMGGAVDKAFLTLGSRPVVAHALAAFERCPDVSEVVLVVRKDQLSAADSAVFTSGMTTEKVEPFPRTDATSSLPPMALTSWLQIARPSPVPPLRASFAPTCTYAEQMFFWSSSAMPQPVSSTDRRNSPVSASSGRS